MLYLKCPYCKNILANKQIPFEEALEKMCENKSLTDEQRKKKQSLILDELKLEKNKYCCRNMIISYVSTIDFIK